MVEIRIYVNYHADSIDIMDYVFADLPMGWGATQLHVNIALHRVLRLNHAEVS